MKIIGVIELPLSSPETPFCKDTDWECHHYRLSSGGGFMSCNLFEINLKTDPQSRKYLRCDKCLQAEQIYAQLKKLMS